MSKNKKNPQKKLSLKERLSKHWNNRNWDLFVALFLRDKEASMCTIWSKYWSDALCNSLTKALFVDKNPESVETTLELINAERGAVSASLEDCADVASDFLKARKNAYLEELSPLKAEARLPAVYATLRKGLSSFISSSNKRKKTQKAEKNDAIALSEKFAAQYAKLESAKTLTTYTTFLKMAEQLEKLAKGTENERTFSAIRAIAALIREISRTGRAENSLRDPGFLLEYISKSIPQGQTHPAVKAMWSFLCQTGERKFGAEWGEVARVSQLSFMAEKSQHQLAAQYRRIIESELFSTDLLALDILRASSALTEQELYILNTVFVTAFDFDHYLDFSVMTQFIEAFGVLTRIGRKWRSDAPWVESVQKTFEYFLYSCPAHALSSLIPEMPYDAMSSYGLILLSFLDSKYMKTVLKSASNRIPFHLNNEDIENLTGYLIEENLPRWTIQVFKLLIDREGSAAVLTRLVCGMIEKSAKAAFMKEPTARQIWTKFSQIIFSDEMAALLPPDNSVYCFYKLCYNMPPYHISNEPSKIEAFLAALPSGTDETVDNLLVLLLTWPDIDTKFLVRLFEKSCALNGIKNTITQDNDVVFKLIELIERMPNDDDREAAAFGMLKLITGRVKRKNTVFYKKTVQLLKHLSSQELKM